MTDMPLPYPGINGYNGYAAPSAPGAAGFTMPQNTSSQGKHISFIETLLV